MLTFFEGIPCGGESAQALIASAWDFTEIHRAYTDHQQLLAALPTGNSHQIRDKLLEWGRDEMRSWLRCMKLDPLLPRALWPIDYQGAITWEKRIACLRRAAGLVSPQSDN